MSLATMTSDLARPRRRPGEEGFSLESSTTVSGEAEATKAFDALARFIPTEALAPFVMAMQYASEQPDTWNVKTVYWTFVFATPFLLLIFEYARTAASDKDWPDVRQLTWRAVAAGIAFAVWGLSIPGNSYQAMLGGIAFTGLMAVSISPILTAIDAIVMRVLRDHDKTKE